MPMTKASKISYITDDTGESTIELSSRQSRARLTPSAVDGFAAIMKAWKIGDEDARGLLGGVSSDFYTAMQGAGFHEELPDEILIRISYLIGIFKALHTVFGNRLADAWMTRPNTNSMFKGTTPLAYCLEHGILGMRNVRRLLEARCQGY